MKAPSFLRFGLLIVKPHGDGVGLGFWSFPIALRDGVGVWNTVMKLLFYLT